MIEVLGVLEGEEESVRGSIPLFFDSELSSRLGFEGFFSLRPARRRTHKALWECPCPSGLKAWLKSLAPLVS